MDRAGFNEHKELILAWAAGAEIEYWSKTRVAWCESRTPSWNVGFKYRIKPAAPRVWYIPKYVNGVVGFPRSEEWFITNRTAEAAGDAVWIRVVEDTSFVPDKPST